MHLSLRILFGCCLTIMSVFAEKEPPSSFKAISEASSTFNNKFIKAVGEEQTGNLVCSPLSVNIVLAMAAIGSGGKTREEFNNVLHLPAKDMTLEGYHKFINNLNDVDGVILKIANRLFINTEFPVKPDYKEMIQTYFRSDIETVNFSHQAEAANTINQWCKQRTNDHIDSIVQPDDLSSDTALMLANAVYFKGRWAIEFDPKFTTNRPFYITPTETKEVATMYMKASFKYADIPEYDATCIQLPYVNKNISMIIILPNKYDGLSKLMENIEDVNRISYERLSESYPRDVMLYLPKFKIESKLDLEDTLSQKMGLVEPFTNKANFSGISEVPLKISKVVQKAFIEVNEEGSEAAAVTGMVMLTMSLDLTNEMRVNRPFYYIITNNAGLGNQQFVLFNGFITKPKI